MHPHSRQWCRNRANGLRTNVEVVSAEGDTAAARSSRARSSSGTTENAAEKAATVSPPGGWPAKESRIGKGSEMQNSSRVQQQAPQKMRSRSQQWCRPLAKGLQRRDTVNSMQEGVTDE